MKLHQCTPTYDQIMFICSYGSDKQTRYLGSIFTLFSVGSLKIKIFKKQMEGWKKLHIEVGAPPKIRRAK